VNLGGRGSIFDATLLRLAHEPTQHSRSYIDEMCLAADIINVEVFLKALKKPGKRESGALWRAGL